MDLGVPPKKGYKSKKTIGDPIKKIIRFSAVSVIIKVFFDKNATIFLPNNKNQITNLIGS